MQRFEFKDVDGTWGSVDEEFQVNYAGRFRGEVADTVEEVEEEYRDPPPDRAMLEVYCDCPVLQAEKWEVESCR